MYNEIHKLGRLLFKTKPEKNKKYSKNCVVLNNDSKMLLSRITKQLLAAPKRTGWGAAAQTFTQIVRKLMYS